MASDEEPLEPAGKIPVTILTGFLGSGKTTLLNNILNDDSHQTRFAIIENEFGEIGVDDKILSERSNEEIIEVMNGCICCTVRGDLVVSLKRLHEKLAQFDAVIIETTGLADPAPVAQTFFVDDWVAQNYVIDGIITVVDAVHILARLDEEKPEGVENEAQEQVAFADRILLNKTDLVGKGPEGKDASESEKEASLVAIEKRLKEISPSVQPIRCQYSKVDPRQLVGISAFSLDRVLEMDPEFKNTEGEHMHDQRVSSVSRKFEGDLDLNTLNSFFGVLLQTEGANLYRYKGVLSVRGMDEKYVFQGVGMLFSGGFLKGSSWPSGVPRESCFVFIGKNLDKEKLVDGFDQCRAQDELRFPVGTAVSVWHEDSQTYVEGVVEKQWEEGQPYKIKLSKGAPKGCDACESDDTVWALQDTEYWIRAAAPAVA